jgi:hypothetical protein
MGEIGTDENFGDRPVGDKTGGGVGRNTDGTLYFSLLQ